MTAHATIFHENYTRLAAECASVNLVNAIQEAGQWPANDERKPLTFEQKLQLVASGKAKLSRVIPIRKMDPQYTIGGVQPW